MTKQKQEPYAPGGQTYILRLVDENGKEFFASQPNLDGLDLSRSELKQLAATKQDIYNTVRVDGFEYPWRMGHFYLGPNTIYKSVKTLKPLASFWY